MDSTFHLPQQPGPPDPLEDRPACPACRETLILLRGFSRCLKCNFTICDARAKTRRRPKLKGETSCSTPPWCASILPARRLLQMLSKA